MTFTSRTILLTLISAVLAISGYAAEELLYIGIAAALLLFIAVCVEFWLMPKKNQLRVQRTVASKLALGIENNVAIEIENRSTRRIQMHIHDEPPDEFEMRDVNFIRTMNGRETISLSYGISPNQRGNFTFHNVNISAISILFGLIQKHFVYSLSMPVKVYPNYKAIKKYELKTVQKRWLQAGLRPVRQFGQGTEYESLREYSPDDEYRTINWNASARTAKLISTHYQLERSQNVMILIDAGRLMGSIAQGLSKLDHAVNAALVLAHVSIDKGDNVGMLVFSKNVQSFIEPGKSRRHLAVIAENLYNVQSEVEESDYAKTFEYLRLKQKRRSLMVVFTEFLDRYSSRILIQNLTLMYPKHLPLCVVIKDTSLHAMLDQTIISKEHVFQKAAAAELLEEREQAITFVRSHGVIVLDVLPEDMTSELINQYIEIKNKSKL